MVPRTIYSTYQYQVAIRTIHHVCMYASLSVFTHQVNVILILFYFTLLFVVVVNPAADW